MEYIVPKEAKVGFLTLVKLASQPVSSNATPNNEINAVFFILFKLLVH